MDLGIGILSWKKPITLDNTLRSYQQNGLLDLAKEVYVLIQEGGEQEIEVVKKYNLPYITTTDNVGIGKGITMLTEKLTTEYYLFLENDWLLIEDATKTRKQIETAIENIKDGTIDCYRLRHRQNYGAPLCSLWLRGQEGAREYYHLMDCVHWYSDPDVRFPDKITSPIKPGRSGDLDSFYIADSRYANHTNNPVIYKRKWYLEKLCPMYKGDGRANEMEVFYWWSEQHFKVGQGDGLFKHCDLRK